MAQISLRIDDEVKQNAEQTFKAIGISTATAITIFLKAVARENRIPFELKGDPFYSKANMERLEKAVQDIKKGRKLTQHELIEEE